MKIEKKAEQKATTIAIGFALIMGIIASILIITNPTIITVEKKILIVTLMLIVVFCFSALIYIFGYLYFRNKNL